MSETKKFSETIEIALSAGEKHMLEEICKKEKNCSFSYAIRIMIAEEYERKAAKNELLP